ncbi:MAG: DUF58 domain-containing protein [Defluviitaleaceae bacterium]|nr:DUF58 domain-containing protein [Defluviitaleaceae bacterium]
MIKNRLTYFLVLGVALFLLYIYEDTMTYVALYMVLMLPIISLIFALISRKTLKITQGIEKPNTLKKQETRYVVRAKNKGIIPVASLKIKIEKDEDAIISYIDAQHTFLRFFETRDMSFTIISKYRGNYKIGIAKVYLYDFLGLFKLKKKCKATSMLTVAPIAVDVEPIPLGASASGTEGMKDLRKEEDYANISDLRKYHPGDGQKKVHWKVSAKKNELISKNFQSINKNTTALVIDNSKIIKYPREEALKLEDAMIEAFVSVAKYCIRSHQMCALYSLDNASDIYSSDFEYLYQASCGIDFSVHGIKDFETYFENFSKTQVEADNTIVFVKNFTESIVATIQKLIFFGSNVIVYHFETPKDEEKQRFEHLLHIGVKCMQYTQK